MITLYKRNQNGIPIQWSASILSPTEIEVKYGAVGKDIHVQCLHCKNASKDINSLIKEKRKIGYKALIDLKDSTLELAKTDIVKYLNTYLPEYNTNINGGNLHMLCKTLVDSKPFEKDYYLTSMKINGERCAIGLQECKTLYSNYKCSYRSREGTDWTKYLFWMDDIIIPQLSKNLISRMIDEGVELDGEIYLPGYSISQINHIIKDCNCKEHKLLQFWCYDLMTEDVIALNRQNILQNELNQILIDYDTKEQHLRNKLQFLVLPYKPISSFNQAILARDSFIEQGYEGLVIRAANGTYQFGKRNNAMLKFKFVDDGLFTIFGITPQEKNKELPIFHCCNDINDNTFKVTINLPKEQQMYIMKNKDLYIGKKMLVEFRERTLPANVPFHGKGIKIM